MSMNEYNMIVKKIFGEMPDDTSILTGVMMENSWRDCIQVSVLVG